MPDVNMPRLSDSMEEGTIVSWLVADGEEVRAGQELAEVETDKATVTFVGEVDGIIELLVSAGASVALGAVVARIDTGVLSHPSAPEPQAGAVRSNMRGSVSTSTLAVPATWGDGKQRSDRSRASPLARRVAASLEVDLRTLSGTGPDGRIVRADVLEASLATRGEQLLADVATVLREGGRIPVALAPKAVIAAESRNAAVSTVVELSRTQELIARRMAESRATVPDFDLSVDVDMEAVWDLRTRLGQGGADTQTPSLNDFVVMACAKALSEQPKLNSAHTDGRVECFSQVNVGVAVSTPDALVVVTLFEADRRSLGEIARETKRLAAAVRDGSITPAELAGGTFTVSNLGMYGVDQFTAVLNPPQAAILAVGAVTERAVVRECELVARRVMTITLAVDHRVVYGADAARFLARVKTLMEQPLGLIVG